MSLESIVKKFEGSFSEKLKGPRLIGREAEFPVVDESGKAADVRLLWESIRSQGNFQVQHDKGTGTDMIVGLEKKGEAFSIEVGLGTIEVITGPAQTLFELQAMHEKAVEKAIRAATEKNFTILGYGIQPHTAPEKSLLTPKQRYGVLHEVLGDPFLYFCVSASDQVHVDITRSELVEMINFGNLISGIIIAFCGNSPIHEGQVGEFLSAREGHKKGILPLETRHGMTHREFTSVADFISDLAQKTMIFLKDDNEKAIPFKKRFEFLVKDYTDKVKPGQPLNEEALFRDFLLHDHYIWNSARGRSLQSTVEIRPACQQPWDEHMNVAALSLGLIEKSTEVFQAIKEHFGPSYWKEMQAFHGRAIKKGLDLAVDDLSLLKTVLGLAKNGLKKRAFEEESFLISLEKRLKNKKNPGQDAAEIFSAKGMDSFIRHVSLKK